MIFVALLEQLRLFVCCDYLQTFDTDVLDLPIMDEISLMCYIPGEEQ